MTTITLVGFGVAGQLLLSHILETVPAGKVTIIDPDFIGGDLAREYHSINTNTTIGTTVECLTTMPTIWTETIRALQSRGATTDTLPISKLASDIRKVGHQLASKCLQVYDEVQEASWDPSKKQWTLYFKSGRAPQTTTILYICTGMKPRQEDYGIPSIPLRIALDPVALGHTVSPGQHILVIGASHSATLILKHLHGLPDIRATCLYRGSPFKYSRDGHANGIKQESADIADAILKGEYSNLTMASMDDIKTVVGAFRRCDWLIQATGFASYIPLLTDVNRAPIHVTWDPATGLAKEVEQCQTFGACQPNVTNDISVGAFVDQISVRWPLLKMLIQV